MSSDEERESMLKEFCARTKTTREKALTMLAAESWDLELAIFNYSLATAECDDAGNKSPSSNTGDDSDCGGGRTGPGSSVVIKKKDKSKSSKNSKFATLQNLNQENSSDEEEGQAFYAGGSVRSGQQILGPGKHSNDIVANMFKSVREHGGIIMHQEPESTSSRFFSGTGYKLGATSDDTIVVKDPNNDKNKDSENVVLRLWRNGFSLNDENLRPYTDPANAEFLEYIQRGELPPELRNCSELILTMEDRRHEDFSRVSSGNKKVFLGKGYMLGSPTPSISGSTSRQSISTENVENKKDNAQSVVNINENEPTTNIQFRLADGTRISGRFNLTHTIANLREYIVAVAPIYQSQTFILLTTFPNKELTDLNQTVKDAGLMNAVVVQRLQ